MVLDEQMVRKTCATIMGSVDTSNDQGSSSNFANDMAEQKIALLVRNKPDAVVIYNDEEHNHSKPSENDVIELNVGGQKMAAFRSTLTAVRNSKLARFFSDADGKINTTLKRKGSVQYFFDYNPEHFKYLLDQLRWVKRTGAVPFYELNFIEPKIDAPFAYSAMLSELGLTRK
jgi:hypothetical protein